MAGLWYVQESFNDKERCMTWNFTTNEDGTYLIKETKKSGYLYESGYATNYLTTGTLNPTDSPGKFMVQWPLSEYNKKFVSLKSMLKSSFSDRHWRKLRTEYLFHGL